MLEGCSTIWAIVRIFTPVEIAIRIVASFSVLVLLGLTVRAKIHEGQVSFEICYRSTAFSPLFGVPLRQHDLYLGSLRYLRVAP